MDLNPRSADYECKRKPLTTPIANKFEKLLRLRNLSDKTIKIYMRCYNQFKESKLSPIDFYLNNNNKRNNLSMLKILFPKEMNFKFPKRTWKPKILPSKQQLQKFYNALPDSYKPIFTLLSESGLRIGELLNCDLDKTNKMLIPHPHTSQTKHSFISFYVTYVEEIPKFNPDSVTHTFLKTSKNTGIKVYPHLLRSVFARKSSIGGMPSHYIDVFCGRIPQSVLARSYTDYSVETLKQIYDKANIQILELSKERLGYSNPTTSTIKHI